MKLDLYQLIHKKVIDYFGDINIFSDKVDNNELSYRNKVKYISI